MHDSKHQALQPLMGQHKQLVQTLLRHWWLLQHDGPYQMHRSHKRHRVQQSFWTAHQNSFSRLHLSGSFQAKPIRQD